MRSVLYTGGNIRAVVEDSRELKTRGKIFHNFYHVMGWKIGTTIPDELSDWLAYLQMYQIIDYADQTLQDDEVMTVRYNLGPFQMSRGIEPLYSDNPQVISILKIGSGMLNIWVDRKLACMIRNGYAIGKKCFAKHIDRNVYVNSRVLATEAKDYATELSFFKGRVKNHVIMNFE